MSRYIGIGPNPAVPAAPPRVTCDGCRTSVDVTGFDVREVEVKGWTFCPWGDFCPSCDAKTGEPRMVASFVDNLTERQRAIFESAGPVLAARVGRSSP